MNETSFEQDDDIIARGVDALVVAGWTGRDADGVDHHIRELEALGVAPPSRVPLFYRVSSALLAPRRSIEVVGDRSSGEVEPMLVHAVGRFWLGLASDHTDRALEAHSVALSKQICAKPCAATLWALDGLEEGPPADGLAARLDTLELRSWVLDDLASENWTLYQEGTLAAIRPLVELLAASPLEGTGDASSTAMLCGTLPAIGGVRPAAAFRMELLDPPSGRVLRHEYTVRCLPEVR